MSRLLPVALWIAGVGSSCAASGPAQLPADRPASAPRTAAKAAPVPEGPSLVAVFPLDASQAKLDAVSLSVLEEGLRTHAANALSPIGYTVLTNETTLQVLQENGLDASKACEASCVLQAAKEIKAKLFVSGSASSTASETYVFLRLFDDQGAQLGSVRLRGADAGALVSAMDKEVGNLFAAAPARGGRARTPQATYTIETTPAGVRVLLDGDEACAQTPCQLAIDAGKHELRFQLPDYVEITRWVTVKAGQNEAVSQRLEVAGATEIAGRTWCNELSPKWVQWTEADKACRALKLAGGGWRLPSTEELKALRASRHPLAQAGIEKDRWQTHQLWSSDARGDGSAHDTLWMTTGEASTDTAKGANRFRCVR